VSLCAAVLKIIEDDHLGGSVLPPTLSSALAFSQLRCSTAVASLGPCTPESELTQLAAEAQSRVKILFADACASMSHCHHLVLSLGEATLSFANRLRDYELAMHCIEPGEANVGFAKKSADRSHRPGRANKPGKPTDKVSLATQPAKTKPRKMNRMNR